MNYTYIKPYTVFIGYFETRNSFFEYFEQLPLDQVFNDETGEYKQPTCPLARDFGMNSYDDDYVDYEETKNPVTVDHFFETLQRENEADRFIYWNEEIIKKALDYCAKSGIGKVNTILYLGELGAWKIKKGKDKKFREGVPVVYCGTYNEETAEEVFD